MSDSDLRRDPEYPPLQDPALPPPTAEGPAGPSRSAAAEDMAEDLAAERSLVEDVRALVEDGKMLAEAEIDFQKKRLAFAAQEAKGISGLFVAAGIFGFFALLALVVGLVIALGELIGYWGSTALVAGVLLVLAVILALSGRAKLRRVAKIMTAGDDDR